AETFGERQQRLIAFRDVDAAADEQQRPLGFGDERGGALDLERIRARAARLRLQCAVVDPEIRRVEIMLAVADVFGYVEHDRAGTARGRDREGAAQQLRNAFRRLDADQLLDGRLQDFDLAR